MTGISNLKTQAIEAFERETGQNAADETKFRNSAIESAKSALRAKLNEFFPVPLTTQNLDIHFDDNLNKAICPVEDLLFSLERPSGGCLQVSLNCPKCGLPGIEPLICLSDLGRLLRGGFSWMSQHCCPFVIVRISGDEPTD